MRDRGAFWSPVPDWQTAEISANLATVAPVKSVRSIAVVSGNLDAFLQRHGTEPILGPRDLNAASTYRLRLAADRALLVSHKEIAGEFGWCKEGYALTDVTDGLMLFDILGQGAHSLMSQGCSYDFTGFQTIPTESAAMIFAGIRLLVSRRADGWRLHVERPLAPALWYWFSQSLV